MAYTSGPINSNPTVAVKLDFDFGAMVPLADSLSFTLTAVMLGSSSLPDIVFAQVALPGKLSGLTLRHSMDTLLTAPIASAALICSPAFA